MTGFIRLQSAEQTIQIGFTDQKVSGRSGLLSFAGHLRWHDSVRCWPSPSDGNYPVRERCANQ